jgi:corrinoid protein of di/trimethylamine methyltransferase
MVLEKIRKAILEGEEEVAEQLVRQALGSGMDAMEILNQACIPGVEKAGALFEEGNFFLPELIAAGQATKTAMSIIMPEVRGRAGEWKCLAKFVIGTVQGDVHDIGKTIVASMLSASGFEVIDLGIDVPTAKFVKVVEENRPEFLGLSALLTSTMPRQKEVIEALQQAGFRDKLKVIVGGAPVTDSWAQRIGADGYAADAVAVVKMAKNYLG